MRRGPKPAKSKVEAKRPVGRKSPKADARVRDLEKRLAEVLDQLQARDAELVEAQEQQTATSEILHGISSFPSNLQPLMNVVAENAARVCGAADAVVYRLEDGQLQRLASYGDIPAMGSWPLLDRGHVSGRAVIDRQPIHVHDIAVAEMEFPISAALARQRGTRTYLSTPLLRDGVPIGVIGIRRREVRPFTDKQIALLQTFADQAVIAIENVRLFNETKEALDRQTATSKILGIISTSPANAQPVFDSIAANALRLCEAYDVIILRKDGDVLRRVAHHGPIPPPPDGGIFAPTRDTIGGRTVLDGRAIHVADLQMETEEFPVGSRVARQVGSRTVLCVPLLREGMAIGAIYLRRTEVQPFTDSQIALIQTFADQAVIAIENVRLFTELQEKNSALTTAHAQVSETLDQQTATSEILRVISQSPTDVQPVFQAILESAVRLVQAYSGVLTRIAGDQIVLVALTSTDAEADAAIRSAFPQSLRSELPHAQAIRGRTPLNIVDAQTDPRLPEAEHVRARVRGFRGRVLVPLLRHDEAIGAISLARREPGGFTDDEIALLQTFADQAVIAIENVRLFTELESRNRDLTATSEILQVISTSPTDTQPVFDTIVESAVRLCDGLFGTLWRFDGELIHQVAQHNYSPEALEEMRRIYPCRPSRAHGSARTILERAVVHIPDVEADPEFQIRALSRAVGWRSGLFVPILREGTPIGAIAVTRARPGIFSDNEIELLKTFAQQAVIAIENVRLFTELQARNREIEDKGRQLEVASQHKSEFLANMSHELRTPLNAIIGFSEVLSEKMFGELNEKQEEYLKDIYTSGNHLLSLINDILDLSKIEAGRMELELSDFHMPTALDSALTLVRERAARRSIALHLSVDERLGQIQADERKVRQVVLNLLSNAIKFTPEGGRIEVGAVPKDGLVEVSVSDTGVGIAPEDHEAVFEEFRQVGTADKKVEGTGLGLTLCRKFVELHGGRIWVKSEIGVGSTFTFTLPVRCGE
jgi:signal transduction histidine kinase